MDSPVLQVEALHTHFFTRDRVVRAVDGVSLEVNGGETVGLVGESGCGKTVLGLSILRLVPEPGRIVSGRVHINGQDVLAMDDEALRQIRGGDVAMTLQDPMTSLNPVMKVSAQIKEAMTAHDRFPGREGARRVVPLMEKVRIPAAGQRAGDYPHQFSGGMRQRVLIAMGIANEPALLIADEATSALDATAQAQTVTLLQQLNNELGTAVVLITHNMGLVAGLCQRVVVMYAGQVVEEGEVDRVFARPQHPYTWHLLQSVPRAAIPRQHRLVAVGGQPPDLSALPRGCRFHPRCAFRQDQCLLEAPALVEVEQAHMGRCFVLGGEADEEARARMRVAEATSETAAGKPVRVDVRTNGAAEHTTPVPARRNDVVLRVEDLRHRFHSGVTEMIALDGVSLDVRSGETLGLIGESGCGKSTLALAVARLLDVDSGRVTFEGRDVMSTKSARLRDLRCRLQVIFQDPYSSLDPRMTVGSIVMEPLDNFRMGDRDDRRARVAQLFDLVGLNPGWVNRHPHELSGGQRQRVGIARALALNPSLVICDEPVSALDVSIQAQILNLLKDLQDAIGLTYLFISHDLGVIRQMSDRVAVMYLGRIVEMGEADVVFARPQHPYTSSLLESLSISRAVKAGTLPSLERAGERASSAGIPTGCRFHPRCPVARAPGICQDADPLLNVHNLGDHVAACHFAGELIDGRKTGMDQPRNPSARP